MEHHPSPQKVNDDESTALTETEQYVLDNYRSVLGFMIFPSTTCRRDIA